MNNIESEVKYERLRPEQIVAKRKACPVAYLPIGTIEWHGEHNPVGLDTLKIHQLLIKCAQKSGGLVFPPLYYGENREQGLMEANVEYREDIAKKMALPGENFASGYMIEPVSVQNRNYQDFLIHIFHEIKSLGFEVLIIGAGHYPLLDHARSAAALFNQEQGKPKMITWAMTGYELVKGKFEPCGDHAGKWETSLLMYLDPGMQDISILRDNSDGKPIGATDNGIEDSTPEFGKEVVEAIVEAVDLKVSCFLKTPEEYQGHGSPM
ncbi:MAG: creatininase family protein [Victivallales bacterium]|nr:creatininase family protein [Victivallales bacterium]